MLLDVILLGLFGAFVLMGAYRGALAAGTSVVSLLLAYGGGVYCAQNLSQTVAEKLAISSLYGAVAAGTLGFLATFIVAGLLGSLLREWDLDRLDDDPRGWLDRAGGGIFGGIRGGLVVLLLSWLVIWLDAARDLGVIENIDRLPQTEDSSVASATRSVVAEVIRRVMAEDGEAPEPGARLMAQLASNPGTALKGLQDLLSDSKIEGLQRDKFFWTLIENGAAERALNRLSFYKLSHDDQMRRRLADLGIVSAAAAKDVEIFRQESRVVFEQVGPKLKGLRNDPELLRLAENPEIVKLLENGDTLALLNRPEIQSIVERIANPTP
ncbi:MAG: CvpA family protein [Myxococcales bacterium]|nr:CvpA family protein [Myxococcales bacterium]